MAAVAPIFGWFILLQALTKQLLEQVLWQRKKNKKLNERNGKTHKSKSWNFIWCRIRTKTNNKQNSPCLQRVSSSIFTDITYGDTADFKFRCLKTLPYFPIDIIECERNIKLSLSLLAYRKSHNAVIYWLSMINCLNIFIVCQATHFLFLT